MTPDHGAFPLVVGETLEPRHVVVHGLADQLRSVPAGPSARSEQTVDLLQGRLVHSDCNGLHIADYITSRHATVRHKQGSRLKAQGSRTRLTRSRIQTVYLMGPFQPSGTTSGQDVCLSNSKWIRSWSIAICARTETTSTQNTQRTQKISFFI